MPPSEITHTPVSLSASTTFDTADNLRNPDTGHDTGGADRPGAYPHFNGIRPGPCQIPGGISGGDIATHNCQIRVSRLDPFDLIDYTLRMTMGRVDYNDIYSSLYDGIDSIHGVGAGAHCRGNPQASQFVLACVGEIFGLANVFESYQATQFVAVVDNKYFLDPVPMQEHFDLFHVGILLDGHQPFFRRHDGLQRGIEICLETHVPTGHDTDKVRAIDHRKAGNIILLHLRNEFPDRGFRGNGNRILDHYAFIFFDDANFPCLPLHGHAFVNDAQSTFLRHGNSQTCFGHRVHSGRNQRDIQGDVPGQ